LPQLLSIFKEIGAQDLPLTTRILIATTDFVNKYFWLIAVTLAAVGFFGWRYFKTEEGKERFDEIKIRVPVLGTIVRNLYLARMAESLSTLIKAGVPILDGLRITADLVGNITYRKLILAAEDNVRGGGSISEVFTRSGEVPPLFTSMIAIGEKTGKIDFMMEHISKFYKSESETAIDSISQLIEPILVLILGFGVAILVSAILLPIYNLVGVG
jgi:type II secretory pathway component PulF